MMLDYVDVSIIFALLCIILILMYAMVNFGIYSDTSNNFAVAARNMTNPVKLSNAVINNASTLTNLSTYADIARKGPTKSSIDTINKKMYTNSLDLMNLTEPIMNASALNAKLTSQILKDPVNTIRGIANDNSKILQNVLKNTINLSTADNVNKSIIKTSSFLNDVLMRTPTPLNIVNKTNSTFPHPPKKEQPPQFIEQQIKPSEIKPNKNKKEDNIKLVCSEIKPYDEQVVPQSSDTNLERKISEYRKNINTYKIGKNVTDCVGANVDNYNYTSKNMFDTQLDMGTVSTPIQNNNFVFV